MCTQIKTRRGGTEQAGKQQQQQLLSAHAWETAALAHAGDDWRAWTLKQ
jgi:hypothetical protein